MSADYFDAMEVPDEMLDRLLDRLTRTRTTCGGRRRDQRFRYRVKEGLRARFLLSDRQEQRCIIRPIDIGSGGLFCISGLAIPLGTSCVIRLKARDGQYMLADGRVVDSSCISDLVFPVRIKFGQPIDVAEFLEIPVA